MPDQTVETSKFLSFVLRHQPESIGIQLDDQGWVDVEELLAAAGRHGRQLDRVLLERVVETNDKRRFAFSEDRLKIRANQGHSVEIDLGLVPVEPPDLLYHGTATRFLDSIRAGGLTSGERRHVHLSPDAETAVAVGRRHGKPVVLTVQAGRMHAAGHPFFLSANGVWLTDRVPTEYLLIPNS